MYYVIYIYIYYIYIWLIRIYTHTCIYII
jgi:hypothetical protein